MEEALTFTRVIENINYVYGERLVKFLLLLVLLETVALIVISKKRIQWIKYFKIIVLVIATFIGITFLSRARIQDSYSKIGLNDTTCAFKEVYDDHGQKNMSWADYLIYGQHYADKYGTDYIDDGNLDLSVICEESGLRDFSQIVACFVIFSVGFIIARCKLNGKNEIFAASLAPIVGAAVIVAMTILFIVFRIPYHWSTVGIFLVALTAFFIWYSIRNRLSIKKGTVTSTLIGLVLIVLSTLMKFYKLAGDARWQQLYAVDLVEHKHLMEEFYQVATYGFLGTGLHAFGNLFGNDMLYAYFLLIGLSAILMLFLGTLILVERDDNRRIVFLFLGLGTFFLLTNFDYLFYLSWILSNCSVGVCILAIVALTYLNLKKETDVTLLIALLSMVVITTRIEGVCYVALLMSVPFNREGALKKVNFAVGFEIVVWQIVQFILTTGVGQDGWTPVKGIGLLLVGIIVMAEPYLLKIKLVDGLVKYYRIAYVVILLCVIGIGFIYDPTMASDNFTVFLSHFTVSKNSNSLALWAFLLLLLPLAVRNCVREKDNLLIVVLCYILMVFGISIFRTGNPLHTGTGDSFRRVLCQIMPLAMWLVTYYAGKNDE